MSLGSLIVQREIASIREVEDALARQVLYGGDFVTNLVEVSAVDEARLVPALADFYRLPAAPVGELPKASPSAYPLLPAQLIAERVMAPIAMGETLVIAVAEPLSVDVERRLASDVGVPIEQRIAPQFRITQALARDYSVPLDKRVTRLLARFSNERAQPRNTFVPPRGPTPPAEATASGAARRRAGPSFVVARALLDSTTDRDAVLDVLFDFAAELFDYTALFLVQRDLAEGRRAVGEGTPAESIVHVGVPLDVESMLATARARKEVVRALPRLDTFDAMVMRDLGRDGTTECLVAPVVVRSRVVALLFGDGGAAGIDDEGARQLKELVEAASTAFEQVILRRKLQDVPPPKRESKHPSAVVSPPPASPMPMPPVPPEPFMRAPSLQPPRMKDEVVTRESERPARIDPSEVPTPPSPRVRAPDQAAVTRPERKRSSRRMRKAMPASELQVSVPPHAPPSSPRRSDPDLPSIMVDVTSEYEDLVAHLLEVDDEDAETQLLKGGAAAMPALMALFPGPITVSTERLEGATLPRVAECGPLLRLVARQRRTALEDVLALVESTNAEFRFWATYLLTELLYPEAIGPAIARAFDPVARIRRLARAVVRSLAEVYPQRVVDRLMELATGVTLTRRLAAIEMLAEARVPLSVPLLVPLLPHESGIELAVRSALVRITQHDFGMEIDRWMAWWEHNKGFHRIEWLMAALMHDDEERRASAAEELWALTHEDFGYDAKASRRARERAQQKYREWWDGDGHVRFTLAALRG